MKQGERSKTSPAFQASRAKREEFAAKTAELDYRKKSGLVVETDAVKKAAFEVMRIIRDRILGVPDRVSAMLAAENSAAVVKSKLDDELRSILADAADVIMKLAETPSSSRN
jgi:hypothetical protein